MNIDKIAQIYETDTDKVIKTLKAAGLPKSDSYSPKQMLNYDFLWDLVENQQKSYKEAGVLLKQHLQQKQSAPSNPERVVLDPEMTQFLETQAAEFAAQVVEGLPGLLKQQKAIAQGVVIRKFWEQTRKIAGSAEFKAAFQQALTDDGIVEAEVLPGEPSALPGSSSSGS